MRTLAAVPLALALAAGCAPVVQGSGTTPPLEGTAWVHAGTAGEPMAFPDPATLRFEGGRAAGSDGCNRWSTGYVARTNGDLAFAPEVATTRMACPQEVSARARLFTAALGTVRRYRVDGNRLELLDENGVSALSFMRQHEGLAGSAWRATFVNNGKGGLQSVVNGSRVTMRFGADGRVSGSAGCNAYTGGYALEGTALRFEPAAATRKMCADPAVMAQEAAFLQALATVATMRIEGERLRLGTAEGATAMTLERDAGE